MALTILGLSGALSHDPSAALYIDGKLVAAAEEERFVRDKHAKNRMPYESAKFCLEQAGIKPSDVDVVAIPFAPISLFGKARWHYAKRYWYAPDRALDALLMGNRRYKRYRNKIVWCLEQLGFDPKKIKIEPVEHHLAHASSAYHCSGFTEKTAIMGIDGKGEYATTFFGYGENGKIHKIKEFFDPDSLGGLYGAITEFLGFEMLDGEFKVMGMAPYGDASKYDFSRLATFENGELIINTELANVIGLRRYKENGKGFYFSPKLIEWLGPKRVGDVADEPYIHYAASMQALFEKLALQMMDHYLGDILKETGKIAFAGGCALNVKLNQRIIARPEVKELFVQPASGDAGTAVGAAAYVSHARGVPVEKMEHVYLGPSYSNEDVIAACARHPSKPVWRQIDNTPERIAEIMVKGNPVAWFQGRMEFGPRALGGRSIIGCPSVTGVADRINHQIKFRERWRPFCPSMLDTVAPQMIKIDHPAPFMTFTFEVAEEWKTRVPEVVHEDGTSRAQVLKREYNPRYYDMMKALENLTGNGVSLNTSLNRRGEPMICSPTDALNMFFGSDLEYLIMEDILVVKEGVEAYDTLG
ncbi:carbamoyltransferase [Pseudomonas syringae]|uniref:carbamoyltransferase family protein n=1 Tax=Pseudomonas syringae TaxID=317 RepID=UPI000465CDD1|nr:carbamoyltransferase [Pseudomonas syringae]